MFDYFQMDAATRLVQRIRNAGGAARTRVIAFSRYDRFVLKSLVEAGRVLRVGFGCYALPDASVAVQLARSANGKLTCISALNFAGLRTLRTPEQIHISLNRNRGGLRLPPQLAPHAVIHREPDYWANAINAATINDAAAFSSDPREPQSSLSLPTSLLAPWPAIFARVAICQPLAEAVVALDSGLNTGTIQKEEILRLLNPQKHAAAIKAVGLASVTSQSVLESLARLELITAGFKVEPQKYVDQVGFVDLLIEDVIAVELDGFEYHRDRVQFRQDRFRDRQLRMMGYDVLRYAYEEVINSPGLITSDVRKILNDRRVRPARTAAAQLQRQPSLVAP